MANVKITQLPSATTPLTGTEVFPLVQGTTTKQVAITGLFTSPVMSNPTLGVVGQADLINATGLPISSGVAGLGAGIATFLGTPSSANLRTAVTDETGSGALVFANAPVLVAPDLGTPSVLVATNATGTAVGLTAGSAITNANLTGAVTSVGNATSLGSFTSAQLRTALTDETGAGSAVFATSPTITAPILNQINDTNNAQILGLSPTTSAVDYLVVKNGTGVGVPLHFYADGSSANIGLHIQPKGTGLVTISDGTDFNKGIRFRSSSSAAGAVTLLDAVSTAGRVVTLPDATTTLVGRDTTDTLTNKTIAFSSNTFSGTLAIANGGTNASTAALAIENLLPAYAGNGSKGLRLNSGATALEWVADGGGTVTSVGGTGTVNGLTLTGTVTTSGNLTLGGTLSGIANSALTNSSITIGGTAIALGASSNALANDITVNGLTVGRGGGNGAANTAYGVSALALVGNSGDVAIGNNAGAAKTTTSDTAQSTFVGYFAGAAVNTGTDNTFIGGVAGRNTTTGTNNVSLGGYSFYTNISGSYNVAIGKDSLRVNLASNNTAVGYQAGFTNQTGTPVTALGYQAGYSNLSGNNNTFLGYQSGYTNSTASFSVFVGQEAGYTYNGSLGSNTLVGYRAGYLSTGDSNTFVGSRYIAGGTSCGSAMTTGSKNTILGAFSGNQGSLDIRTASNYIVLSDGDGNPLISTADNQTVALEGAVPNSGTGITFPADATVNPSANANTLDDYEEGTWTPSVTFSGNAVGLTYNTGRQLGRYTKIGNRVYVNLNVELSNKGSSTGDLKIEGLPFATENITFMKYAAAAQFAFLTGVSGDLSGLANANSTVIGTFTFVGTGSQALITNTQCTNDLSISLTMHYSV